MNARPVTTRSPCACRSWLMLWVCLGAGLSHQAAAFDQPMMQIEEQQIISWAFGDVATIEAARRQAEDLLAGQIAFVEEIGTIQASQRRKLELAGQGDIVRFFERTSLLLATLPRGSIPQNEWQQIWQKLQPVRQQFALGLHEQDSLFRKTLLSTLTVEQRQKLDQIERERSARHYRAQVDAALSTLDQAVPLSISQRMRLVELLTADRDRPVPRLRGQSYYQYHYVLYRMSELPQDELTKVFDPVEWKVINRVLDQVRGMKQMFKQLEENRMPAEFAFF